MLETEFLKLKYHANVESNTDEVDAEEYFNNNYKKIDANAKKQNEDLVKLKEDLEQENNELASNMPWNTVAGKSLHITDSAKYSKNKLSISGDMEQEKRSGKNKFNVNDKKSVNDLITVDANDWITATYNNSTGTNAKYMNYMTNKCNKIKANTNYALFLEVKNVSGTGEIYLTSEIANEKMQFNNAIAVSFSNLNSNKIYKHTITSKTDLTDTAIITMMRSFVKFNAGENGSITFRISVLEDTSVTTENFKYEKYGAMPSTEFPSMPVVCTGVQKIRQFGKNLFDYITNFKKANNGLTNIINTDGSITTIGKITSGYTKVVDFTDITNILEDGQQYTLKQDVADTNLFMQIRVTKKDGSKLYYGTNYSDKVTFTVNKTVDLQYDIYITTATTEKWGNDSKTITNMYMLYKESDNEDDSFEPYAEEVNTLNLATTKLCSIKDINGNVVAKDRPVYRNGKWQWEKNVKKLVLTGNEKWRTDAGTVENDYRHNLNFTDNNLATALKIKNGISNYFSLSTNSNQYTLGYFYVNENWIVFWDKNKEYTLEQFKAKIQELYNAGTPVIIYYGLATPEYIDCTAEQSAVLDKLYNNFALQKGTNNIIVESENGVGLELDLSYMQDNNLLKEKEHTDFNNRITTLENLLSTTQTSALLLDNLQSDLESEVN